jgi:glycosyltransferase involved in cell wall biosynthesis
MNGREGQGNWITVWKARPMSEELLSFVIPTFNSMKTIGTCLSSIPYQEGVEVIVVDNFSNDSTVEICKKYPVKIYQVKSTIAKARNFGVERAKGKYIVRLDSDEIITKALFNELTRKLREQNPDVALVIRHGLGYWESVFKAIANANNFYLYGKPLRLPFIVVMKREIFLKVKQDETLHRHEDTHQSIKVAPYLKTSITLKHPLFHLPTDLKEIVKKRLRLHKLSPAQMDVSPYEPTMNILFYTHRYSYILRRNPSKFFGALLLALTSVYIRVYKRLKILK